MTYAPIAFAIVFLVVGLYRIVEFKSVGVSLRARRLLIPGHVVGCLALSAAMILLAVDEVGIHKPWTSALFLVGVLILFPTHIYVAIKRRLRLRETRPGSNL